MSIEILKAILLSALLVFSIAGLIICAASGISAHKMHKTIERIKKEQKEQDNSWTSNHFDKKI
jgi:putative effector of murein hydrolase LrgA (UPF0299 family)